MKVTGLDTLMALREANDLAAVELDLDMLLVGNLPLYAVRFALWALKPGGVLTIRAAATLDTVSFVPGRWSFQFLTQLLGKGMAGLGEMVSCEVARREIICRRTAPILPPAPWSAFVVYSGNPSEKPLLQQCLAALLQQAPISEGGQLVVCGPEAGRQGLELPPSVDYLAVETRHQAGRFLIGAKKNEALRHASHERVLICHTRIALQPGCLEALPREFDLITPRVWVQGRRKRLPYLDLGFVGGHSVALFSRRPQPPIHYPRERWLSRAGELYPYVDGGLVCVRRSLALKIPMSDVVAWGEAEDVEWAMRLMQEGHVLELAPGAHADSLTCKTARYARWGHLRAFRAVSNLVQHARALRHRLLPVRKTITAK